MSVTKVVIRCFFSHVGIVSTQGVSVGRLVNTSFDLPIDTIRMTAKTRIGWLQAAQMR